jgi:2-C-methyl-D-erythritol 2,4-cyclodiphosphate synthase
MFRVGQGYDIHPFAGEGDGRPLVLGGVRFSGERGLAGHSDADVVVHAICDALLGAMALGDMGRHFPDSDPSYRGVSSLDLLKESARLVAAEGWKPVNVDVTLVTESPKIAPRVGEMREVLARTLGLHAGSVSVKGTRPEGIGALGAGAGIACLAVALITQALPGERPGP